MIWFSAFIVHDGSYCHVTAIIEKVVTEMFKFYNFYFIFNRLLRHFFFYKKVYFRLKDPSCSLQAIVFIIARYKYILWGRQEPLRNHFFLILSPLFNPKRQQLPQNLLFFTHSFITNCLAHSVEGCVISRK